MIDDILGLYPACPSEDKHISTELLARFSCTIAFETTFHQDNTLSRLFPTNELHAAYQQRWCIQAYTKYTPPV